MNVLLLVSVFACMISNIQARVSNGGMVNMLKGASEGRPEMVQIEVTTSLAMLHDQSNESEFSVEPTSITTTLDDFDIDGYLNDLDEEEDVEVDEHGCHVREKNRLEAECFDTFQRVIAASMSIPDTEENEKEICCAVEEYEKCSVRGYFSTHCENDKEALKETLKAARIFLGALTRISCSGHRGRCTSASSVLAMSPFLLVLSLLPILFKRH